MIYTPLSIFAKDINKAVIFLNHPVNITENLFKILWRKAYPIAFVDGFANQVYNNQNFRHTYLPNFVTGDFDSIEAEVLQFYRSQKNVTVVETPDQDETDFTKCLRILIRYIEENNTKVGILTAVQMSGGRFDHEMALIKTLYDTKSITSRLPLFLVTECSITFLLDKGEHIVYANTGYEAEHVGLIPIGQPCQVTTKGLQWNLDNTVLSFNDGIVSTSNRLVDEIVEVKCNHPLVFTMEYNTDKVFNNNTSGD
uniref:Thiamine pyrophosphokinase n=1 Tax=Trichobilharzia regenti TaxID=157069 RepID=A0AA85KC82_TRIRE|nr:unnamed protein product [Trichobilharzia regenti]